MAKGAKLRPFASEAQMCARFLSAVDPNEWTAFAETAGWDVILVRKADGFQIGIQAKLRLNTDVINQALEDRGVSDSDRMAPDCRAVLVPDDAGHGFGLICKYIGLTIIRVHSVEHDRAHGVWRSRAREVFTPDLPKINGHDWDLKHWHEWAPIYRHRLPDYVPDVAAGSPSPVQLTDWKIQAIKIAVILEKRGYLLRSDFKHVGIDHRRWLPSGGGWLSLAAGRYIRGPHLPDFKAIHPRNYEEIAADYETWKPEDPIGQLPLPEPTQEGML